MSKQCRKPAVRLWLTRREKERVPFKEIFSVIFKEEESENIAFEEYSKESRLFLELDSIPG